MTRVFVATAALALLCLSGIAQADVFNLEAGLTNLETVQVGDAGNPGELSGVGVGEWGWGPNRVCGAVAYVYSIGKYEITAAQYCDFLNHKAQSDPYGLYNTKMANTVAKDRGCKIIRTGISGSYTYSVATDWANMPVNYVSYWDALRFVNWLNNGQGNANTETGSYNLNEYNGIDGRNIQRNVVATWYLASEDEWYKAAYYKGGGINAGYWDYPTQSDLQPSNEWGDPTDPGNNVTYYSTTIGTPYWRTIVGEHENSESFYGTFDQGGNVWEWNEAIVDGITLRGLRGGNFDSELDDPMGCARGCYNPPNTDDRGFGFRVVKIIPEPARGMNNKASNDPIVSTASAKFNFKVWGKVTILDANSFTLDDGSGTPVKVIAPGYSGIQNGNYASAPGKLSGMNPNRVLNAQASDVVKMN